MVKLTPTKTTDIGPVDSYPNAPVPGARPVIWFIDGKWEPKGWLMLRREEEND